MKTAPIQDAVRTLGIVVTLHPDQDAIAALRDQLGSDHRVGLSDTVRGRLPCVVETQSLGEERSFLEALQTMPGVAMVHLAFHHAPPAPETADAAV